MENHMIELELYGFTIKGLKSDQDRLSFMADIPSKYASQAAELLIHGLRTGVKLKATFEVVSSTPGDLQDDYRESSF